VENDEAVARLMRRTEIRMNAPTLSSWRWMVAQLLPGLEGDAAQGAEENVGEGSKPQPQLVGAHGRARRTNQAGIP
jgi:hypothetical protein